MANNTAMKNTSMNQIVSYLNKSVGLELCMSDDQPLKVKQRLDGNEIRIDHSRIEEVLDRIDADGKDFLQINFHSGLKILLTEQLIGFKPMASEGLEVDKLPNVVTTPDLFSVYEAIQEAMSEDCGEDDVEVLKRVFEAVVLGGEAIGFDLSEERLWLQRLTFTHSSACA